VISVVDPDERSAAAGVTGVARNAGAAISPSLSSVMMASAGFVALPFYLAGGLKIVYDLLVYRDFRGRRPPEEMDAVAVTKTPAVRPPPGPPAAA
jgi:sugar phosphate permease